MCFPYIKNFRIFKNRTLISFPGIWFSWFSLCFLVGAFARMWIMVNECWYSTFLSISLTSILLSIFKNIPLSCRITWSSSTNLNFLHKSTLINPSIASISFKVNPDFARTGDCWHRCAQTKTDFPPDRISCPGLNISFKRLCNDEIIYSKPWVLSQ